MSWRRAVDRALDGAAGAPGSVRVEGPGEASADLEVERTGPIGVRVRKIALHRAHDADPVDEAHRLSDDLRSLPHRIEPVEVDAGLGGAILRSRPDELREQDFFEVRVDGARDVTVGRQRIEPEGRVAVPWDMTRDGLGRVLDELDGDGVG